MFQHPQQPQFSEEQINAMEGAADSLRAVSELAAVEAAELANLAEILPGLAKAVYEWLSPGDEATKPDELKVALSRYLTARQGRVSFESEQLAAQRNQLLAAAQQARQQMQQIRVPSPIIIPRQ